MDRRGSKVLREKLCQRFGIPEPIERLISIQADVQAANRLLNLPILKLDGNGGHIGHRIRVAEAPNHRQLKRDRVRMRGFSAQGKVAESNAQGGCAIDQRNQVAKRSRLVEMNPKRHLRIGRWSPVDPIAARRALAPPRGPIARAPLGRAKLQPRPSRGPSLVRSWAHTTNWQRSTSRSKPRRVERGADSLSPPNPRACWARLMLLWIHGCRS